MGTVGVHCEMPLHPSRQLRQMNRMRIPVRIDADIDDIILGIRLIASGGMSSIDDLKKLQAMGVYGAITGKALYEGKITMAEIRALGGM